MVETPKRTRSRFFQTAVDTLFFLTMAVICLACLSSYIFLLFKAILREHGERSAGAGVLAAAWRAQRGSVATAVGARQVPTARPAAAARILSFLLFDGDL